MAIKPVKPKRPPKTLKEKAFAKEYVKTLNATEAANRVYDVEKRDTARNIGAQNVAKLSFEAYFAAAGATDEAISQNMTRIAFTAKKRDQFSGEITENDELQLRAMAEVIKVQGKYAPTRAPVDEEGKTVMPVLVHFVGEENEPE